MTQFYYVIHAKAGIYHEAYYPKKNSLFSTLATLVTIQLLFLGLSKQVNTAVFVPAAAVFMAECSDMHKHDGCNGDDDQTRRVC